MSKQTKLNTSWADNYIHSSEDNTLIFQLVSLLKSADNPPASVAECISVRELSEDQRRTRNRALLTAFILVVREQFAGITGYKQADLPARHDQALVNWLYCFTVHDLFQTVGRAGGSSFYRYYTRVTGSFRRYGRDWNYLSSFHDPKERQQEFKKRLLSQPALYNCLDDYKVKGHMAVPYVAAFFLSAASVGVVYGLSFIFDLPGAGFTALAIVLPAVVLGLLGSAIASFICGVKGTHAHRKLTALLKKPGAKVAIEAYDHMWAIIWKDRRFMREYKQCTLFEFISSTGKQNKDVSVTAEPPTNQREISLAQEL